MALAQLVAWGENIHASGTFLLLLMHCLDGTLISAHHGFLVLISVVVMSDEIPIATAVPCLIVLILEVLHRFISLLRYNMPEHARASLAAVHRTTYTSCRHSRLVDGRAVRRRAPITWTDHLHKLLAVVLVLVLSVGLGELHHHFLAIGIEFNPIVIG